MARKKTTKKSSKRDPERNLRNKRVAVSVSLLVGAAGIFVGASMGIGQLEQRAAAFVVDGDPQVQVEWPKTISGEIWMPINERDRINQLLNRSVKGTKALSQTPLIESGRALMSTGWIEGTPRVRWTSEGVISIQAAWREPAAAVRVGNREIIIDWSRRVLPLDYASGESNLFFFTNADARIPDVAQQWPGTDLQDGLELLLLLQDEHTIISEIAGFDLGSGAQSGTLRIVTTRDARIVWGAGPGRERPGEQPASVKVDRLKILFDGSGLVDQGVVLDIRGPDILLDPTID
jgi:hypothetical protein